MIPFSIPIFMIAGGVPIVIVGAVMRHRAAQGTEASETEGKLFGAAYMATCIALWIAYFYGSFLYERNGHRSLTGFTDELTRTPLTGDSVLDFLIWACVVLVAVALVPGFIGVGLYLLAISLGLAFFLALVVTPLISLAAVSPTGALIAAVIVCPGLYWLFKTYGPIVKQKLRPVLEPIYGTFFDWWLTPYLRRKKEKRQMDDLHRKRMECEALVLKLQSQDPAAVADIQFSSGSDSWLERVIERFHDRDRQKSIAERTRLLEQATKHFTEYKAMLMAYHELTRAGRDARIRELERDKKELGLAEDIADIKELRGLQREKERLTQQHELEQLRQKISGGPKESPYQQGMKDKKARRLVDIEDQLFEALEHPILTEVEARLLYKKLRQKI